MRKTMSGILAIILALVSVSALLSASPFEVSAETYYKLDFTSQNMVFDATNNVWTKAVGDMSCLNYPGYAVVDKTADGGAAAIRKFVAPTDGAFKLAWGGGVYIDNSQGNLTGATVEFAVTNEDGQILFPKNGDVATIKAGTPLEVSLDIASVKKGDVFYFVVMNPSVSRVVCVLNFAVMVDGKPYTNGSGQLYDSILQGGKGWHHQYAASVKKSVSPNKPDLGGDTTPDQTPTTPDAPDAGTIGGNPSYTIEAQTNGFVEMQAFMNNWWWADAQGQNPASPSFGMANGTHTQPPAPGYMTAKGYTVERDGLITFSGTVMLDINATMNVPENADAIGFMVIEKKSNMVLYPSDKASFMVMKNTQDNRTKPTMISGSFEAKAGDEILFITRNETNDLTPSVQVIMDVYRDENGVKTKIANTHEQFSNKQGKNGWRYYYASIKGFKTPLVPAAPIFDKATHFESAQNAWYLLPGSVKEQLIASYGAKISRESVTLTERTTAAIGYKATAAGKQTYTFTHEGVDGAKQVGFCVVKKSTFEPVTKWQLLDSKKQTVSGSFTTAKSDEYLFVFAMLGTGDAVTLPISLKVDNVSLADALTEKQGNKQFTYYFASTEDVCAKLLNVKRKETPFMSADEAGIKNVVFDPYLLTQFDEEKWMWSVSDWENPSSDGYMAVLLEGAHVSTPNYSMVRSYEVQSDCVVSVYGNLFSEVPEFLGVAPNEAVFDMLICNDRGQIMYPEDQGGFYAFKAADLTAEKPMVINVSAKATAGDKVYIVFRNRSNMAFAYLYTHLQIFETPEGENPGVPVSGAAENFSDTQGMDGWNYYYTTNDSYRFVKGTKLDKVITGNASSGLNSTNKTDKMDKNDADGTGESPAWMKVMFWVSAGIDVVCIALLVLYVVWKMKTKGNRNQVAEAPAGDKTTPAN